MAKSNPLTSVRVQLLDTYTPSPGWMKAIPGIVRGEWTGDPATRIVSYDPHGSPGNPITVCVDSYGNIRYYFDNLFPGQEVPDPGGAAPGGAGGYVSPPGNVVAIAGNGIATVDWMPSIVGTPGTYTITPVPALGLPGAPLTVSGGSVGVTVSGLRNGVTYTFEVVATDGIVNSLPSFSNPVTPGVPAILTNGPILYVTSGGIPTEVNLDGNIRAVIGSSAMASVRWGTHTGLVVAGGFTGSATSYHSDGSSPVVINPGTLTHGTWYPGGDFSADETHFAIMSGTSGVAQPTYNAAIYIYPVAGGSPSLVILGQMTVQTAKSGGNVQNLLWLPDGTFVYLAANPTSNTQEVRHCHADGTSITTPLAGTEDSNNAWWGICDYFANGDLLVMYTPQDSPQGQLIRCHADGTNRTVLYTDSTGTLIGNYNPTGAAVSTDETEIAVACNDGTVRLMPVTGGVLSTPLVSGSGPNSDIAWGPLLLAGSVNASGIGSGQAFGTPSVTAGAANIHPTGIVSQQAFGTAHVFIPGGAQTISPLGVPSAQAFGTAIVSLPSSNPQLVLTSVATDTFNRANGTIAGANNWAATSEGSMTIVSNQISGVTGNTGNYRTDTYNSNQYSSLVITATPTSGLYIGVSVRNQDSQNNYTFIYYYDGSQYYLNLYKKVAGSYTSLMSEGLGAPLAVNSVLQLVVENNVLTCTGGNQEFVCVDNTFSSGGTPGLEAYGATVGDNWTGGNAATGAVGAATATDNFNRANGNMSSGQPNWIQMSGYPAFEIPIVSNQLNPATNAQLFGDQRTDTFAADQWSQIQLGTGGNSQVNTNGAFVGATTRMNSGQTSGYLGCNFSGTTYRIYRLDSGVATLLISTSNIGGTLVDPAGTAYTLVSAGSRHSFRVNGSEVLAVTDSTYTTGKPGVFLYGTCTADNWSAGNV